MLILVIMKSLYGKQYFVLEKINYSNICHFQPVSGKNQALHSKFKYINKNL